MAPKYNKELYRDDVYQWQEGDLTATRTTAWGGPWMPQWLSGYLLH